MIELTDKKEHAMKKEIRILSINASRGIIEVEVHIGCDSVSAFEVRLRCDVKELKTFDGFHDELKELVKKKFLLTGGVDK